MATLQEDTNVLRDEVKRGLSTVNLNARRYQRLHISLVILKLMFGVFATILAGDSALGTNKVAEPVAQAATGKTPSELPKGWKIVCGLIFTCSLIATIAEGVH